MKKIKETVLRMAEERDGVATVEWTIAFPFSLILVVFVSVMLLFILSWSSYGSVASTIAKSMNTRLTGLSHAMEQVKDSDTILYGYSMGKPVQIKRDQVRIIANKATRSAFPVNDYRFVVYRTMKDNKESFFLPYTRFKSMDIDISSPAKYRGPGRHHGRNPNDWEDDFGEDKAITNCVVKVTIYYDLFEFDVLGVHFGGIPVSSTGYSVIT